MKLFGKKKGKGPEDKPPDAAPPVKEVREDPGVPQVIPPVPPAPEKIHKHQIISLLEEAYRVVATGYPVAAQEQIKKAIDLLRKYEH